MLTAVFTYITMVITVRNESKFVDIPNILILWNKYSNEMQAEIIASF